MATAKSKSKKIDNKKKIIDAYIKYVLTNGQNPRSAYIFSENLGITEKLFYDHFSSFHAIKAAIWEGYINDTLTALDKDEQYQQYRVREKLLAFYYTLIEILKSNRSFVMFCFEGVSKKDVNPVFLRDFKEVFESYVKNLIEEGMVSNEIVDRPVVGKRYHEALWIQLMFVINFWSDDTSKQFESTDAAIEKAVSLSFDLLGPGPLDSILDFTKFLYNNRK